MPTYTYRDEVTGFEKDVFHSMAEIDNPSEKTIEATTYEGRRMNRVPVSVAVTCSAGISRSGAIKSFKSMHDSERKDFVKKKLQRSKDHFKSSGLAEKKAEINKEFKRDAINTLRERKG